MGELLTRRRGLILPSGGGSGEYQKVDYIESHMAEYINTGYVPTSVSEITSVSAFTSNATGQYVGILQQIGGNYARWHYNNAFNNAIELWRSSAMKDIGVSYNTQFKTYFFSDALVKIDNNYIRPGGAVLQTTFPFHLFARVRDTGVANFANVRQKDFIVKEGGVEVMHLVPCYRKSDGVIGMLDEVSGTFFTNEGGGAFTKGADV